MLFGAMLLMANCVKAAAPNSYVRFNVNGMTPSISFNNFSDAVPNPQYLGAVYRLPDTDNPNISITGYQVVINTEREGFENETSHYMLAYIGVYDNNIANSGAYFDTAEQSLFLSPTTSSTPVAFGHQFFGGEGQSEPMNEVMSASQFVWSDGMIDNAVLPDPLVYDTQTESYKRGQYQKGHSYVIAIHFTEMAHVTIEGVESGIVPWEYPAMSKEYTSFNWKDRSRECLLARFTYAGDEASTSASVVMMVNGESKQFNLLGEGQDPVDLGTVYRTEVTMVSDQSQMTLPNLGFDLFNFESAVPYTYADAAGTYGGSMTFTTLKKSEADLIDENFEVDCRDYKTGNFGPYCPILCASELGLVQLSEDWAYGCGPLDVWVNWLYSGTHPVMAGWAANENFVDGETYTVVLYFTEYSENLKPVFIHRNGGKYYKFNFTYSDENATGINTATEVRQTNDSNTLYDLQGRKLSGKPARGIYMENGKKVLVK